MAVRALPEESITDLGGVRARFRACVEADTRWRTNALIDLKYRAGTNGERSYQWPDSAQDERNRQGRPFITINRIDPFLKQVENQARQANISIQVLPLKGDISEAGAEARQGLIRHILSNSDGEVVGDLVFRDALTMGKGWAQVYTDYDDIEKGEQEIFVRAVPDVFSVYADPAATKPDRRDMRFAFAVETLPREEFDQFYPGSGLSQGTLTYASLGAQEKLTWFPGGSVTVADYYSVVESYQTKGKTRSRRVLAVKHQKITALEVLEETEIPITRIPLVPEFGDEYRINGQVDFQGMVRNGREAQRLFNFFATALAEQADLSTDTAVIMAARQVEGLETYWTQKRLPYRIYNDTDSQGNAIGADKPERQVNPPPIQGTVEALQMADMYLKEVFALYDPSLGQGKGSDSGRKVLALQQQGEIGNFNYIDNHKRFLRSLGLLLLEMAAVYYDTPRIRRIIGKEETPKSIVFHAGDDNAPTADDLEEWQIGADSVHDLRVGKYDVTVTTGPNTLSKRQAGIAAMLDLGKTVPQTVPIWIDLFFKNADFPGAMEVYERMKRTISAQFQEQDPNDQQMQLAQAHQQLQALGQQHDLMVKELTAKNAYIQTEQAKHEAQVAIETVRQQTQVALQQMKDATTIEVARINAAKQAADTVAEAAEERIALMGTQVHEAHEAELSRQHELGLEATKHANKMTELRQAGQNASMLSGQEHGQALEQSDNDTANTMTTQAQQAALTPAEEGTSGEA